MPSIATITWDFVPGSLSTLVEYRVSGTTTWIKPTSPNNPTATNSYPLTIDENVFYDVRLTTNGIRCAARSTTFQIFKAQSNCCPSGFTLSTDQSFCFQTNTTTATPPSGALNTVAQQDASYGIFGTLIFDLGFNVNGTGTFTKIPPSNAFWVNGVGYPSGSGGTSTNGPCNRTGLWASTTTSNQDVGFSVCINAPADGTYYVGCMGDNYVRIDVDGTNVLTMDVTAIENYLNSNGLPGQDAQVSFRWWFIYPIALKQGARVLNIIGHNDSGIAAMGCEVYNLTPTQIQAATSYGAMGSGLLFSSKDFIGQPIQIGTGGTGYTCPSGYSLTLCSGPASCTQTLTTAIIPCTTTTTTTTTSTSTTTTTTHTTTTTSTTTTTTTT